MYMPKTLSPSSWPMWRKIEQLSRICFNAGDRVFIVHNNAYCMYNTRYYVQWRRVTMKNWTNFGFWESDAAIWSRSVSLSLSLPFLNLCSLALPFVIVLLDCRRRCRIKHSKRAQKPDGGSDYPDIMRSFAAAVYHHISPETPRIPPDNNNNNNWNRVTENQYNTARSCWNSVETSLRHIVSLVV